MEINSLISSIRWKLSPLINRKTSSTQLKKLESL
jgi:hypothetical protein